MLRSASWSDKSFVFGSHRKKKQLRAIGEDASVQQKPESVVTPVAAGVSAMAMAFERQEALYNRMYNVQSNRHWNQGIQSISSALGRSYVSTIIISISGWI